MRYHALVPLAAAAANLIVCIPVVRKGMREPIFRAFLWMTLTIVAWKLVLFALYYFSDEPSAEGWMLLFLMGVCFVPAPVFWLALVLSCLWVRCWLSLLLLGFG